MKRSPAPSSGIIPAALLGEEATEGAETTGLGKLSDMGEPSPVMRPLRRGELRKVEMLILLPLFALAMLPSLLLAGLKAELLVHVRD